MLNELAKDIHQNAIDHGWWDEPRNFGEALALIHAEVSEVLEDWRKGRELTKIYWMREVHIEGPREGKEIRNKPDGIPIEFADIIIRVLDLCAGYGIDIEEAITEKMVYNRDRPYRHGNLKA